MIMTDKKCFIITSLQPWDIEIGSTIKNTAIEISKNNKVIYISTPIDYITYFRKGGNKHACNTRDVINKKKHYIHKMDDNLIIAYCNKPVLPLNKIPTKFLFNLVNYINNKKIAKFIRKIAKEEGISNFIHMIDTDIYRSQYLKEMIKPALSVYYCRDFIVNGAYWKKHGLRLETSLARKSDIVLTNSTYFAERFKPLNNNIYAVETGVNLELYDPSKKFDKPEDMTSIKSPVIGYVGLLTAGRLDIDLIYNFVKARPQYNFIFVGPENDNFKNNKLYELENIFFLGKKDPVDLPKYIQHFDVCINPQLINEITIGNYPLKIDEYLAMGKPVVATDTHTMRDIFSNHVYLASNKDEYTDAIDKALHESHDANMQKKRIEFAQSHSWSNSVGKIYDAINRTGLFK